MRRLLFVLWLAAGACGSSETGSVTVAWTFQGLGCEEAGVQTVHVFIGPLEPTGSYDREVQCSAGEGKGLRARGVATGRHVVVLKGLAHDHVLYELTQEMDMSSGMDLGRLDLPAYVPAGP
jgi:hypothetical protein